MNSRLIDIIVENNTDAVLKFGNAVTLHGKVPYVLLGDDILIDRGQCTVCAEEADSLDDFGLQGAFSFLFHDYSERVFNFAYQYSRENGKSYARVSGPTGYTYTTSLNHLSANRAIYTITLQRLGQ